MNSALKSLLLCSCFFVSSVLASAQGTTCAADSETAQGSAIGCVTGEGVVVQAGADAASQGSEVLPLTPEQRPAAAPVVIFREGKLAITAKNSDLGEILRQVGEKTGATIDVPEGANERVVSQLGPGTPRDVIAALLNGSHYNYVVLGNETDANAVARVVLTAKSDGKTPSGSAPVDAVVASGTRPVIQPRTALQQAVMQPYQEMLQQQQAQQLVVPDFQQQAQATPAADGSTPAAQPSVTGEAGTQPAGAETASVESAPASDAAQRPNGERTPQQMLQDLYETRRQMIQQQNQQRVAQQQPPQQP